MEKTSIITCLLISFLLISCSVFQIHAKTQRQYLSEIRKTKRNRVLANIEIELFSDNGLIHDYYYQNINPNQKDLKEKDIITRLPGQPPDIKFKQYGGYITVNKIAGRALYYYFVEAQDFKADLPLLLWLNGGPGCSSIGYGAMEELGPFRVLSDGKTLYKNKYSWNYAANVLFLESPIGVGFSYSNTTHDYQTRGDSNTAADNLIFLLNWFERFPTYKNREFYISGESYAGHYVPQLARNILRYNKYSKKSVINLKGLLMGNACLNEETDNMGTYDHYASHALISHTTIKNIHKFCNFSNDAVLSAQCNNSCNLAYTEMGNINIDNTYAPLCKSSNLTVTPKRVTSEFDPCSDKYVHAYLNRPDVQEAMHANITKLSYDWEACSADDRRVTGCDTTVVLVYITLKKIANDNHTCSDPIFEYWKDNSPTVLPLLHDFLANGLRVWIYSGDIDGNVPVTATRYSINAMKLPVTSSWRPWYFNSEVGGYTESYGSNLTFSTVRGAGHEVPSYQPARALVLVQKFLAGKSLPPK